MTNSPTRTVLRFNLACDQHDSAGALALLAENVVFESTEPAPDGRRYTGKQAVAEVLAPLIDAPGITIEVEETFEAGDRVVQRTTYRWTDGHVRSADLFQIQGQLITEILSYVKG